MAITTMDNIYSLAQVMLLFNVLTNNIYILKDIALAMAQINIQPCICVVCEDERYNRC